MAAVSQPDLLNSEYYLPGLTQQPIRLVEADMKTRPYFYADFMSFLETLFHDVSSFTTR